MNNQNLEVLTNIISAVESGGQVYGKRRYDAYDDPYKNTPNEHTITIGWAQCYGHEARELIQAIQNADPTLFAKLDTCTPSISSMLSKDWVAIRWKPSASQKAVIIRMIDTATGHAVQDRIFRDKMQKLIADCIQDYPGADVKAQMMYCEIRHLGGRGPANRIFKRCGGDYSLDRIMASLVADQRDTTSQNQVGDKIFWSRHLKCRQFIDEYAVPEDGGKGEEKMAKITEKDITICGHGSGNPRTIRMDTYLSSRYNQRAGNGKHKGVVAVRRFKALTDEGRKKFHDTYRTILGRNIYSQTLRGYCYTPYHGRYYSDCSSSVCLTLRQIGYDCPALNTAGIYTDSRFETVPVVIKNGHIQNPEILKVGDFLEFVGNDPSRPLQIGHVEAVYAINGGSDPEPGDKKGVAGFQAWMNRYYPDMCKRITGDLLLVDGDYGAKTRGVAVSVWKHMMDKYYGSHLTIGNLNFFGSCKKEAEKINAEEVEKHGTLCAILQGLLSARGGYYTGEINGKLDDATGKAVIAWRKKNGFSADVTIDAPMWYVLFN